jgi:hypothetical protein
MKSSEKPYDDLTVIRGIGPARQQWLQDSLGVRTYEDLAALSADDIESRLRADGQIPSRSTIEAWLVQARTLAAEAASAQVNSPVQEDGWKPVASFVVEFQVREPEGKVRECRTAVHHMEKDRGTHWPGIEHRRLCQWMVDQIRDEVELEPEEGELVPAEPAPAPPTPKIPTRIQIRQLRVFQPPHEGMPGRVLDPGQPFEGLVQEGEPFVFEVDLELTGPDADSVARRQVECTARSYAYNRVGDQIIHLGDSEPCALQPEKLAYTFALPEATLPHGSYRLWVEVTPQSAAVILPDYIEIPIFPVE